MRKDQIFFIIVTYTGKTGMLPLLRSISNHEYLIIANTDNFKSSYNAGKKDTLFRPNTGYGDAANFGANIAFERGASWVIISNPDIEASHNSIDSFCSILLKQKPCIAGPFIGMLDERRYTTYPYHTHPGKPVILANPRSYISGCFIAIHKDVYVKLRGFNPKYFLYYEDVDICIRARRKGLPCIYIPSINIIHSEKPVLKKGSFEHKYYLARNHMYLVFHESPLCVKLYEILRLPKTIIEHIVRKEYGAIYGIKDYMINKMGRISV